MATRILVIDDMPDLLKRMRVILESQGYTVDSATNAEEGLKLARANKPHLMCIDITMPKVSGFDLVETIRSDAQLKDTPILVISARSTPDTHAHAQDVGADAFLVKPFKQKELFDEIERLLKERARG